MINEAINYITHARSRFLPFLTLVVFLPLLWIVIGCAGGIPSVPSNPEDVLRKGDAYFQKRKYFPAQEMYKAFMLRYPGHARSDYAQFMLAESYFEDEDYPLAAVEYRILVSNYGYSDYVDDGYFKEGVCLYEQCPKPTLDQTKCYEGLDKFNRFVQIFPNSPLIPEVQAYIEKIHVKLAKKDLENAKFYFKNKRWDSALIYLDKIIENYPNNYHWCMALYFKALIMVDRFEYEEAIALLSEIVAYPEDIDVKGLAKRELRRLHREEK